MVGGGLVGGRWLARARLVAAEGRTPAGGSPVLLVLRLPPPIGVGRFAFALGAGLALRTDFAFVSGAARRAFGPDLGGSGTGSGPGFKSLLILGLGCRWPSVFCRSRPHHDAPEPSGRSTA